MASEEKVAQLREFTGLGQESARQLLQATDWNLEEAISLHFGLGDDALPSQASSSSAQASASSSAPPSSSAGYSSSAVAVPAAAREPQGPRLFNGTESPGLSPLNNGSSENKDAAVDAEDSGGFFGSIGRFMSNISQAVLGIAPEEFESWFAVRYGRPCPPFSKDCFGDSVAKALAEGRLVMLWFHQEEGEATENLCRQVFQNEMVLQSCEQNFVCWAGDVNRFEPGQIARLLGATMFPTVVVLQPLRHGFDHTFCLEWPLGTFAQPLFRLSPTTKGESLNVDQAITALVSAAQDHGDAQVAREEQRLQRDQEMAENRRLREAQEQELEESMLIDQLKAISEKEAKEAEAAAAAAGASAPVESAASASSSSAAASQAAKEAEEAAAAAAAAAKAKEAEAEEAEKKRQARGAEITAKPEPEPAGSSTAKISLKLPSGERMQRVFRVEETLNEVYEWAHCCRPVAKPMNFELWTSFPAKALSDRSITVGDCGLAPSVAVFMKAVEE